MLKHCTLKTLCEKNPQCGLEHRGRCWDVDPPWPSLCHCHRGQTCCWGICLESPQQTCKIILLCGSMYREEIWNGPGAVFPPGEKNKIKNRKQKNKEKTNKNILVMSPSLSPPIPHFSLSFCSLLSLSLSLSQQTILPGKMTFFMQNIIKLKQNIFIVATVKYFKVECRRSKDQHDRCHGTWSG